jgi:MscS family membrane protein
VYFNGFSDSSLDILLYCFVECPDWSIELREKHRLYLDIVRLAKSLGVSFAFPTRTLHMFQEDPPTPGDPMQDAQRLGQRTAAQIAGPPRTGSDLPGPVEFPGPTEIEP